MVPSKFRLLLDLSVPSCARDSLRLPSLLLPLSLFLSVSLYLHAHMHLSEGEVERLDVHHLDLSVTVSSSAETKFLF